MGAWQWGNGAIVVSPVGAGRRLGSGVEGRVGGGEVVWRAGTSCLLHTPLSLFNLLPDFDGLKAIQKTVP